MTGGLALVTIDQNDHLEQVIGSAGPVTFDSIGPALMWASALIQSMEQYEKAQCAEPDDGRDQ